MTVEDKDSISALICFFNKNGIVKSANVVDAYMNNLDIRRKRKKH
jgi:hypothetical protein